MMIYRGSWRDHWPVAGLVVSGRTVLAVPPVGVVAPSGGAIIDSEARAVLAALLAALQQQGIIS